MIMLAASRGSLMMFIEQRRTLAVADVERNLSESAAHRSS
jgi:hypothetical protein